MARVGLITTAALSLFVSVTAADTLHNIGADIYQHHGSSWIFPPKIGEFTRIGMPQDVDGTIDVIAYYARETKGGRMTAIVDVYPPDSSAAQARYDDASAALQSELHSDSLQRGALRITSTPPLAAVKASSAPAASSFGALYFIDTGAWIVKIRTRMEQADEATAVASDEFVQQQRWDSLQLTPDTCTGPACSP